MDYAREGILTFKKFWPGDIIAYTENPQIDDIGIPVFDLLHESTGIAPVLDWAKKNPALQGITPEGWYNYNYDLFKFCRKVFAQAAAAKYALAEGYDFLYWLDGDVRFKKDIPSELPEQLLELAFCGFLGRQGYHLEAGIVGWKVNHPLAEMFWDIYTRMYLDGSILSAKGFHDCWALEASLKQIKAPVRNWTPYFMGVNGQPMMVSPWAEYAFHLKGNLKRGAV